jgi:acetyl-CoA carboxylase biotin carboxyl carrier protein
VIDVQQVRELIELMVEHNLGEIRIKQGETTISLRRGPSGEISMAAPQQMMPAMPMQQIQQQPANVEPAPEEDTSADDGLVAITSPMVGTYYASPNPESPPFVAIGTEVNNESPICIIEAMKVFNEIKAEVNGTIERILVQDEQAVEFGQPLMMVRPSS